MRVGRGLVHALGGRGEAFHPLTIRSSAATVPTLITHWRERLRFLGYELEGRRNPNGTGWLHLNVRRRSRT